MIARYAVCAAAVALAATPARADNGADLADAKQYYEAGKQAYKAGQFRVAANAFEAAYERAPRPSTVFSLAQALRRLYFVEREPRDLKRALDLFKEYIREFPDGDRRVHAVEHVADLEPMWDKLQASLDTDARAAADRPFAQPTELMVSSKTPGARASIGDTALDDIPVTAAVEPGTHKVRVEAPGYYPETVDAIAVEARLILVQVDLRAKPAELIVRGSTGARVVVDGQSRATLPLREPLQVPAGEHFVAVVERGREPYADTVRLTHGEHREIDVELRTTRQRRASYWVMGGAGGLLLAGGVTMAVAWSAQSDAQDITNTMRSEMRALTPDEGKEHTRLLDRRNKFRGISYGLTGTALLAGGVGALLYFFDTPEPTAPRRGITITPGPAAGAGVALTF